MTSSEWAIDHLLKFDVNIDLIKALKDRGFDINMLRTYTVTNLLKLKINAMSYLNIVQLKRAIKQYTFEHLYSNIKNVTTTDSNINSELSNLEKNVFPEQTQIISLIDNKKNNVQSNHRSMSPHNLRKKVKSNKSKRSLQTSKTVYYVKPNNIILSTNNISFQVLKDVIMSNFDGLIIYAAYQVNNKLTTKQRDILCRIIFSHILLNDVCPTVLLKHISGYLCQLFPTEKMKTYYTTYNAYKHRCGGKLVNRWFNIRQNLAKYDCTVVYQID